MFTFRQLVNKNKGAVLQTPNTAPRTQAAKPTIVSIAAPQKTHRTRTSGCKTESSLRPPRSDQSARGGHSAPGTPAPPGAVRCGIRGRHCCCRAGTRTARATRQTHNGGGAGSGPQSDDERPSRQGCGGDRPKGRSIGSGRPDPRRRWRHSHSEIDPIVPINPPRAGGLRLHAGVDARAPAIGKRRAPAGIQ